MASETPPAAASPTPGPSKLPMILALVNSVALLGAGGMLIYTKLLFRRPAITESDERARLEAEKSKPAPASVPGLVHFEPVTVNIDASSKPHYVTLAFSLELKDVGAKDKLDFIKPMLMDRILSLLGRKPFHELTSVQGRYVLRTQILDLANELAKEAIVTNVFFTQFITQ